MKILRVRRGYTTNSSSTNEWFPNASSTSAPSPGSSPPPVGKTITIMPTTVVPAKTAPTARDTSSNYLKVGGLIGIVALIFLIERLVRFFLKKKSKA
jgi:hypothetical protein